ncbi:cyclin-like protein [Gilbertella persicaria]|uniref:cyclin-like protein n=1 Tax=Gilbertella persicaria TaxID=101096 RepID=UPI00221EB4A9|nr:cyclin-like protein [Gilbertella persicaria]KAI8098185.1 cyclin-like protein [Gilbertella persicaria]
MTSQWYMQKEESRYFPSILKGMKYEEELMSRLRAVCLIQCVGYRLELPIHTVATASALFHRFYTRRSFYEYKSNKIAQACLFIACKSDESSRRANDIAKSWLYKPNTVLSEKKMSKFIADLLYYELIVLEITCFDMQIDHPYVDLFEFAKEIHTPNDVIHAALAFINDSLRLPLCLWYDPKSIAATALLMGYHGHDIPFPSDTNTHWGQYIEKNTSLLTDITASIMEVYKLPKKYHAK